MSVLSAFCWSMFWYSVQTKGKGRPATLAQEGFLLPPQHCLRCADATTTNKSMEIALEKRTFGFVFNAFSLFEEVKCLHCLVLVLRDTSKKVLTNTRVSQYTFDVLRSTVDVPPQEPELLSLRHP